MSGITPFSVTPFRSSEASRELAQRFKDTMSEKTAGQILSLLEHEATIVQRIAQDNAQQLKYVCPNSADRVVFVAAREVVSKILDLQGRHVEGNFLIQLGANEGVYVANTTMQTIPVRYEATGRTCVSDPELIVVEALSRSIRKILVHTANSHDFRQRNDELRSTLEEIWRGCIMAMVKYPAFEFKPHFIDKTNGMVVLRVEILARIDGCPNHTIEYERRTGRMSIEHQEGNGAAMSQALSFLWAHHVMLFADKTPEERKAAQVPYESSGEHKSCISAYCKSTALPLHHLVPAEWLRIRIRLVLGCLMYAKLVSQHTAFVLQTILFEEEMEIRREITCEMDGSRHVTFKIQCEDSIMFRALLETLRSGANSDEDSNVFWTFLVSRLLSTTLSDFSADPDRWMIGAQSKERDSSTNEVRAQVKSLLHQVHLTRAPCIGAHLKTVVAGLQNVNALAKAGQTAPRDSLGKLVAQVVEVAGEQFQQLVEEAKEDTEDDSDDDDEDDAEMEVVEETEDEAADQGQQRNDSGKGKEPADAGEKDRNKSFSESANNTVDKWKLCRCRKHALMLAVAAMLQRNPDIMKNQDCERLWKAVIEHVDGNPTKKHCEAFANMAELKQTLELDHYSDILQVRDFYCLVEGKFVMRDTLREPTQHDIGGSEYKHAFGIEALHQSKARGAPRTGVKRRGKKSEKSGKARKIQRDSSSSEDED